MAKKTEDTGPQDMSQDALDAAVEANKEIQAGAYGGLLQGANPMNSSSPGSHFVPYSHLGTGGNTFQDSNQFKVVQIMREADKAYREIGLIRNIIDIMTDFTAEGLNVHHKVAAQERFYRAWMKKVGMEEVTKQALRGMYKWANVGIFRFWGKIRPKTRKEMMAKARELFAQGKDKEAVKAFFREDKTVKKGRIPVRYSCIPPFRVRIYGSLLFDTRSYFYSMPEIDRQKLLNPEEFASTYEKKLMNGISPEMRRKIEKDSLVELPTENFCMLQYKRDCSRLWADPIVLPVMNDLRYKQVLRRLDISVAESIINPITIFKLGKTVEGFAPTKEQFQNLANLLKTPVATKTLVWSDLIEVEQHIVDAKEVFSMEKYHEVDLDILNGFGVSLTLINGGVGGGAQRGMGAQAFLSVRTLLERLEDGRQEFMKFLNAEMEVIRKAMGWKTAPIITWDRMNLRDEASRERILIELRDRKIISNESLLDQLDMNNDIEMARKKREDKQANRMDIPQSVGPFEEQVRVQNDEDPARLTIDLNEKQLEQNAEFKDKDLAQQEKLAKEAAKNTTAPKPGPGRPGGKGDPNSRSQKKKRDTKPAGMGSISPELISKAHISRVIIEDYFKPKYLESLGKDNLRKLTKDEKNTYESLITAIWSLANPTKSITPAWVKESCANVSDGNTKPNSKVLNLHNEKVVGFRIDKARQPNHSEKIELFAECLAFFYENI